ncbi:MAG: ATP-binding protein [Actinomycetota bacterium]|nr:ATP-binding protein [Actinomycetota bacterium]
MSPHPRRSARLWQDLEAARAARRTVLLTGQTSDVLVHPATSRLVRLPELLALFAAEHGGELVLVDSRQGCRTLSPPSAPCPQRPIARRPAPLRELLAALDGDLDGRAGAVTILADWACLELAGDDGALLRYLLEVPASPAASAGHQLVVVFRTGEPPAQLTGMPGFALVRVGLPDAEERRFVLSETDRRCPVPLEEGLDIDSVAINLGGIDSDGLLRCAHEARARAPLGAERISEIKAAEIERTSAGTLVVDRSMAPNGLAGMAGLRLYLESCRTARMPLGAILLAGVPGVGKTYSFRYLAQQLRLPAVVFGQLRAGIVGQSERNWQTARRCLEATAPAALLLDEVDLMGLGRRTTNLDSGVSDHLRTGILELANTCAESGISFVMATNNPAGMDPAGLDRCLVIPCLHPGLEESVQIMALAAEREGWSLDIDAARSVLAGRDRLNTGRHLVRLLRRAARHAASEGRAGRIDGADLHSADADSIPLTDQPAQEYMALSALALADSQESYPWVAAARLGETPEVPAYVRPFLDSDNNLDHAAMHVRINQLQASGHGFQT